MKSSVCHKILNMEIAICNQRIESIDEQMKECAEEIESTTTFKTNFVRQQEQRLGKLLINNGRKLKKKFDKLFDEQHPTPDFVYDENNCVNLTRKSIPKELLILLSFGRAGIKTRRKHATEPSTR